MVNNIKNLVLQYYKVVTVKLFKSEMCYQVAKISFKII